MSEDRFNCGAVARSEIDVEVGWLWDGGFEVRMGTK
jgi:hypothetical protein